MNTLPSNTASVLAGALTTSTARPRAEPCQVFPIDAKAAPHEANAPAFSVPALAVISTDVFHAAMDAIMHSEMEFFDPALIVQYGCLDNKELQHALARLTDSMMQKEAPATYFSGRQAIYAINLTMNQRQQCPPRFRPSCKVPWATKTVPLTPAMILLSNDKKIIDLHWLHSIGKRDPVHDNEFRDLFKSDQFDFGLASRFVLKSWTTEVRVDKILGLADVEQWQLASLVTKEVAKYWQVVNDGALKIDKILREAAYRKPQIKDDINDFRLLWIADQICKSSSLQLIGSVYEWQTGKRLAKSTLSGKLTRMRKWSTPT